MSSITGGLVGTTAFTVLKEKKKKFPPSPKIIYIHE